jgi:hypothetical protein
LTAAAPAAADQPVLPAYGSRSLADVLPSVVAGLGLPRHRDTLGLPASTRVCVLLVDGLGSLSLDAAGADIAPTLTALPGGTLTVGVPSTTVTSLGCLGTGRPPGAHGLVGYTFRLQGHGLLNALRWAKDVVPQDVQAQGTIFEEAAWAGVSVSHVGPPEFEGSGLTLAALRGATYRPAATWGERIATVSEALRHGERSLVLGYVSDLDATGRRLGALGHAADAARRLRPSPPGSPARRVAPPGHRRPRDGRRRPRARL